MAKKIKFNLIIDGNRVSTFEEMQDNLSAELLQHLSTGKLAKWFVSREMVDKAAAVQAIDSTQSDFAQLVALCEVLDLEADEDILAEILAIRDLTKVSKISQVELTEVSVAVTRVDSTDRLGMPDNRVYPELDESEMGKHFPLTVMYNLNDSTYLRINSQNNYYKNTYDTEDFNISTSPSEIKMILPALIRMSDVYNTTRDHNVKETILWFLNMKLELTDLHITWDRLTQMLIPRYMFEPTEDVNNLHGLIDVYLDMLHSE